MKTCFPASRLKARSIRAEVAGAGMVRDSFPRKQDIKIQKKPGRPTATWQPAGPRVCVMKNRAEFVMAPR